MKSRWLRRGLWLLGALAGVWALAWLGVPWLIRTQLEKAGTEQLGRVVSVGAVEFRPWSLEITVTGLAIASQDGKSAQLQVKRLYANAELESLLRLAPVVDSLEVEGPSLRLTHLGAGKYDIDDVLARLARPKAPEARPGSPVYFALFNLSLKDGSVDFDDRSVQRVHALRSLNLGIPFISNLEARRTVKVEPRLSFVFNGSRFESAAQSTPFAPTRKTEVTLRLHDQDLSPYLAYIPSTVPVRLQRAVLGADLQLAFEQAATPMVKLSGWLELSNVKLANQDLQDLLAFDRLRLVLDDVRPLERQARISAVELTALRLDVRRDASGRTNLDFPAPADPPAASAPAASAPAANSAVGAGGWKVEVARLVLRDGSAHWMDEAVMPRARMSARDVGLDVSGITWPMLQPVEFQGTAAVLSDPAAPIGAASVSKVAPAAPARLAFGGSGTDQNAALKLSLDGMPLAWAAPYVAQLLEPSLRGRLQAELGVVWKAPDLQLTIPNLVLEDLALSEPGGGATPEVASVKSLHLTQGLVDLAAQSLAVGKLVVNQPRVALVRGEDQRWMFERWFRAGPSQSPSAGAGKPAAALAAAAKPAWNLLLADLALDGGSVAYLDKAAAKPVAFELSALKLLMKNVRPNGNRPAPVQLSARIRTERGEPGQLDYRGTLQMLPLLAQGSVVATQIPVHAFEPYFGAGLNIELLRADTSFKGDLRYALNTGGTALKVSGDVLLEEFRANSLAASDGGLQIAEELLSWKALNLRGLDLAQAPGTPTTVAVKETTLSDFFARVIIHESGRINLQNLVKSSAVAEPGRAGNASAPGAASASASSAASSQTVNTVEAAGLAPVVTIGPISLINGKVLFSDRFVKPNYSANLSDLTGKLSAFSSVAPQGQPQLADLELRGRAEGTASLEILGKLNPLAQPLALDIKGKVRDLELPPLSPYSVKYAGHGIERGKLSVDVAYLVLPNGQLTASNKLVLNQLTFGDKVDGAPASLPVKLAVALLADRNGVIDIDLPVSGSLNDPQFRLGPIIVKVIVNLIVKAVTAPFSLLASAFGGGGDELGSVAFAPGSAVLGPEARTGLDKVAKALAERPALRMTVVGTSSLEAERDAYKRERLHALMLAEKRRVLVTTGAVQEAAATTALTEAEVPVWLKEVFRRADIAKPRDLGGLVKEVPLTEMEALLLANIPVTDQAMRELALQRSVAVKDYLGSRQLPVERLFLGAVKPVAADEKWSPRAELVLANN